MGDPQEPREPYESPGRKNSPDPEKSESGLKTGKIVDYSTRIRGRTGTVNQCPWDAPQGRGGPSEGTLVP